MASTFTWLDYSEQDRRHMRDLIDIFAQKDARDELGIGVIRDAFADLLFPGTGTVQTRARYFFFIPWMYMDLERRGVQSAEIAAKARKKEVDLIEILLRHGELEGVIGRISKKTLHRLPSNIYWLGLWRLGFLRFPGSQEGYHRCLDAFYRRLREGSERREESAEWRQPPSNWNPGIPPPPADFPTRADFTLRRREARFLREQIMTNAPASLFAFLVRNVGAAHDAGFVWDHPLAASFPDTNRREVAQARNFSEMMHGASLLYNLLLARKRAERGVRSDGGGDDWVQRYVERSREWRGRMMSRKVIFASWDVDDFWLLIKETLARVPVPTKRFVDTWIDAVRQGDLSQGWFEDVSLRELIISREYALKGKNARLTVPAALEQWNGDSGTRQLAYRWDNAHVILHDIASATGGED